MPKIVIPKKAFLPCYQHLLNSDADIEFLWGGRDSGKSYFIASMLVLECLRSSYFRCILVRKVFNSIKDSQWQMIRDVVESWGLSDLFDFTTSPIEIRCKNGNKFICRGMDNPAKVKSTSNPSHCWAEEMNQLDLNDFIVIMTSLRSNKGRVKVWCSFNPESIGDYEEFWLYKTFFSDHSGDGWSFKSSWSVPVGKSTVEFKYQSTHTTYKDNKYCPPERAAFLEQLAVVDPYYYRVFTLGLWGNISVSDPYCYAFDKEKHVKITSLDRRYPVYLSFDFNVNPITCGVYQHAINQTTTKIRCIESIKLDNSDIYKILEYINTHYKNCSFLITGDATGRNTSALVEGGIHYYTVIKNKLKLANTQIKTPSINPSVKGNRVLVNIAFHSADIAADPQKCKHLIFDWKNVSVKETGDIDKGDRANPKKRADHLDHWRYYLSTFHNHLLKY